MLKENAGRGALRAAFIAAIPLVAVGILTTSVLASAMHETWAVPWAAAVLPFMAISAIVNGYGYGMKNVRAVALFAIAAPVATLSLLAIGLSLQGRTPAVAIPLWFAANALVAIIGFAVVYATSRGLPRTHVKTWPFLVYALRVGATGIVSMLNYRINVYIVAALTPHADLGFYTTAVSAAETLLLVAQVSAIVTVPHIGSLPRDEAAQLTARCVRNNLVLVGACSIGLALIAQPVVAFLYGNAFLPAVAPLRILLIGMVPWSAASMISSYYTLNGRRPQVALITAAASAVASAGISFMLVPRIGLIGAAIATTVTYTFSVLVMVAYFSKETKIPPSRIFFFQREDLGGYRRLARSFTTRPTTTPSAT
jgi:O-antigen/teichoic acid export membrane protein